MDDSTLYIDTLCDRFEADLRSGKRPEFEQVLRSADASLAAPLTLELLAIHVELRGPSETIRWVSAFVEKNAANQALVDGAITKLQATGAWRQAGADQEKSQDTARKKTQAEQWIGPYRLLEKIGEGGMGSVWKAQQTEPIRREVALKIIRLGLDHQELLQRFDAERQALALMDHPNIARIFDAGTTERGQPYFAMELVRGVSLQDYCDAKRLSIPERLELIIQVCQGVEHAHMKGVIHRDLKPTNILVTEVNGRPVTKIIDFGLVKAQQEECRLTDSSVQTEFGRVLGTIRYMSPEQAMLGSLDVDTRADIYAIGVVLYELLVGETPMGATSLQNKGILQALEMVRDQESPRPSLRLSTTKKEALEVILKSRRTDEKALVQTLTSDLDWIVGKSLENDRDRRYETATEFAKDVRRFLDSQPIVARPPTTGYRVRKFVSRHRGLVASLGGLLCILAAATAVSGWYAHRARIAAQSEQQQRQIAQQKAIAESIAAKRATDILQVITDSFDTINPDKGGQHVARARDVLASAENTISQQSLDLQTQAALLRTISTCYLGLGEYESARSAAARCVEMRTELFGRDDDRTLDSVNDLAIAITELGDSEAAIDLLRPVRERLAWRKGTDARMTLEISDNFANALAAAGQQDEALKVYLQTKPLMEETLGPQNPATLQLKSNLAALYFSLGNVAESLELLRECYEGLKQELGDYHPQTLRTQNNFAVALQQTGRLDEAKSMTRLAFENRQKVLGPRHPGTLSTANNLATIYLVTDEADRALALLKSTLAAQQLTLGQTHASTLRTMANVGQTYAVLGQWDEAIQMIEQAFELQRQESGVRHPDTIQGQFMLATALVNAGRLLEGFQNFDQVYRAVKQGVRLQGQVRELVLSQRSTLIDAIIDEAGALLLDDMLDASLRDCRALAETELSDVHRTDVEAIMLAVYLRQGNRNKAEELARTVCRAGEPEVAKSAKQQLWLAEMHLLCGKQQPALQLSNRVSEAFKLSAWEQMWQHTIQLRCETQANADARRQLAETLEKLLAINQAAKEDPNWIAIALRDCMAPNVDRVKDVERSNPQLSDPAQNSMPATAD